ncbi:hypothetical protein [Leifsonia sp. P73]|uniref:hypothetical protein n=1 Tax=Leifsonia sp. P73 TaxID=3423959 RepID=UPI003DA55866
MSVESFPALTSREVASIVGTVSAGMEYPDERSMLAAAARAALSSAIEPGDTDAALLVGSFGPLPTLRAVIGETSPQTVRAALRDAGSPALLPIDRLRDALDRWRGRLLGRRSTLRWNAAPASARGS